MLRTNFIERRWYDGETCTAGLTLLLATGTGNWPLLLTIPARGDWPSGGDAAIEYGCEDERVADAVGRDA